MRDATDRRELEHELRSLAAQREHDALHDPLTGLANRRKLFARLDETTTAARAVKTKLALLLIDLDHFKELNDTLGHQAGDRLLQEIRPRLMAGVPEADLIARVGGDEFALLLHGAGEQEAREVVGRIVNAVEANIDPLVRTLTASFGIAPRRGREHPQELLRVADEAMYAAKRSGTRIEVAA